MTDNLIEATAAHVQAAMSGEGSGHDWWHVWRVWQTAKRIADYELTEGFYVDTEVDFKFAPGARIKISYSADHGDLTAYQIVASITPPR